MTKKRWSEVLTKKSAANFIRLFRWLNDCMTSLHYLFHPRYTTFFTLTKGTK
jgi:hypothetical protein